MHNLGTRLEEKGSRVCHVMQTHDVAMVVGEVIVRYREKPWLGIPTGKVGRRSSDGGMYTRCSQMLASPTVRIMSGALPRI